MTEGVRTTIKLGLMYLGMFMTCAFALPVANGFHVGCNAWNGDTQTITRAGVQWRK
jgi:hypothetical protein